jgi:hypothetical protein
MEWRGGKLPKLRGGGASAGARDSVSQMLSLRTTLSQRTHRNRKKVPHWQETSVGLVEWGSPSPTRSSTNFVGQTTDHRHDGPSEQILQDHKEAQDGVDERVADHCDSQHRQRQWRNRRDNSWRRQWGADQWSWQEQSESQQSPNGEWVEEEFHSGAEEEPSDDWGQSGSYWIGSAGPEEMSHGSERDKSFYQTSYKGGISCKMPHSMPTRRT